MTPSPETSSPLAPAADAGREIASAPAKSAILMHTDTLHSTTDWLHDAWRLWARTTEHPDISR